MAGDGRLAGQLDELLTDAANRELAAGFAAVVTDGDTDLYLGSAGSLTAGGDRPAAGHRPARHHREPARRVGRSAHVRPRHAVGVRDQHRLAGRVIEAVTGQDLGAYLGEHVLGPLGMTSTTFTPEQEARERLMTLHERREGSVVVSERAWVEAEFFAGGHGLYSTAGDYGRFMRAILRGGELDGRRVLSQDTVDLAFADQLNGLPLPDVIPTQAPWLVHDVVALPFRQTWGFGFQLMLEDVPGMRHQGSGFWSGVLHTHFWIDRSSGVAGAVLTQLVPMFDEALLEVVAGFEMAVYANA